MDEQPRQSTIEDDAFANALRNETAELLRGTDATEEYGFISVALSELSGLLGENSPKTMALLGFACSAYLMEGQSREADPNQYQVACYLGAIAVFHGSLCMEPPAVRKRLKQCSTKYINYFSEDESEIDLVTDAKVECIEYAAAYENVFLQASRQALEEFASRAFSDVRDDAAEQCRLMSAFQNGATHAKLSFEVSRAAQRTQ